MLLSATEKDQAFSCSNTFLNSCGSSSSGLIFESYWLPMKLILTASIFLSLAVQAQKIEAIYFNLYTDSLKKGVYNYINVDGKYSDGKFLPLMNDEVEFSSTAGTWEGNSIIIDTASKVNTVVVTAVLKKQPLITKSVTIFIKQKEENIPLKTVDELLDEWKKKSSKRKNKKSQTQEKEE